MNINITNYFTEEHRKGLEKAIRNEEQLRDAVSKILELETGSSALVVFDAQRLQHALFNKIALEKAKKEGSAVWRFRADAYSKIQEITLNNGVVIKIKSGSYDDLHGSEFTHVFHCGERQKDAFKCLVRTSNDEYKGELEFVSIPYFLNSDDILTRAASQRFVSPLSDIAELDLSKYQKQSLERTWESLKD
ncbi:hypothetical protein [Vibrio vulnificus]|uniref:hypothetical protein n=1 Tax=Vibrio vulnificus TaxID=672 RepID=UPI000CD16772|nr:hypothetical protein [Vibrio vulnificus]EJG0618796.1 hypothetical protein [Vibrio parahaemolyticus]EJG1055479.1 hypothetical protein [Vibrio parahaemolyticus]POB75485.1 hypothetical protein CRN35_23735 [Vibrio vulnificus]POB79199.1 hypothetical protein CRN30_15855 [Vibrio vulnificus]